jgi:hypothetical protein
MLPTNGYGSKSSSKQRRMAMTVQNPTNKVDMKFGDSRKMVSKGAQPAIEYKIICLQNTLYVVEFSE